MKKLKNKNLSPIDPELSILPEQEPYEIVFADPRDEEINLKFLKKSQINAHMARWFLDQEYNQLIWSDGVFEILELDARKYGANYASFIEMVHPDDRDLKNQTQENLKKTFKPMEINYRLLFDDGRIKWINEICNTDFDQEGHPIRSYGTIQDITKYKLTEENFRQKEEQFQGLIQSIPSGVAILQDNEFAFVNLAGKMILCGNSESKLDGENVEKIIHPESKKQVLKKFKEVADGKSVGTFEDKLVRPDGSEYDAEITVTSAKFHDLPALQLIVNDITKRKKIEEDLRKSEEKFRALATSLAENEKRLTDLVATKDKFFSIIAHDLRSPFNSILGFLDLLQNQFDVMNDSEKKSYLKLINIDAQKTLKLLDNLLVWAKIQTGNISFQPFIQKLLPIIRGVEETLGSALQVKQIDLNILVSDEQKVFADTNMITSIFRNLISNAIKYSYPGGMITVNAIEKNDQIEVMISDMGTGMSEETRKRIFQINGGVSLPGTADEVGSGLGLILCREFIDKHNGTIWVESEQGTGSKFIFKIPFQDSTD